MAFFLRKKARKIIIINKETQGAPHQAAVDRKIPEETSRYHAKNLYVYISPSHC